MTSKLRLAALTSTVAATCFFGALALAQQKAATPAPQKAAPAPAAAPAGPPRVYVSDETGNQVTVIDPVAGRVVEQLNVGKRPRGLKAMPGSNLLLVALSGSPLAPPGTDESKLPPPDRAADGIGIVDLSTSKVLRIVKSGDDPESFDVSLDGKVAFVSNEDKAELTVVELATGKVLRRVKVGEEPEGVTTRPDGRVVYVTSEGDGEVTAVSTTTYAVVGHMKTADRPRGIAFTKDSAIALVACENGVTTPAGVVGVVTVIDAKLHKVIGTIQIAKPASSVVPSRPMGIALSPDSKTAYVSLGRAQAIAVIDIATRKVTRLMEKVGERPWGIGISVDGKKLYTANGPGGDVSIVDIATGTVDKKIPSGKGPWGISVK